jgi:dolichol-phosphate mannosyltransferase
LNIKYLLAIPVFNEQAYVESVLKEARRYAPDIAVIDDGSTDETPILLSYQPHITVIRHESNIGYGRSLADAFRLAAIRQYDWLISMDCDEQHEPAAIPQFVEAARQDDADIISGSRYLEQLPGDDQPPAERRNINRRITEMINARLNLGITDAFCGFKAYRVEALRRMHITDDGYAMPLQLWVQAWRLGLRIRELPVRLVYKDPNRHFGGALDDPISRYHHYVDVFEAEMLSGALPKAEDQPKANVAPTATGGRTCATKSKHGCLSF